MSVTSLWGDGPGLRIGDPAPPFFLADSEGTGRAPLDFKIAGEPVLVIFEPSGAPGADAAAPGLADILSPAGPLAGQPITIFHIQPGSLPASPPPESAEEPRRPALLPFSPRAKTKA